MPNIPDLPEDMIPLRGVHMNTPPPELVPQITGVISRAVATMKPGERGKVVWVAQKVGDEKTVNAAIVTRHDGEKFDFTVTNWIGKTWGEAQSAGVTIGTTGEISWAP